MTSRSGDPTALTPPESVLAYMKGVPPESTQFDFLLGEWRAETCRFGLDGGEIGRNDGIWRARHLHQGRILFDEFIARLKNGTEISYMATLRTYCSSTRRWEMTFLVAHQPQLISSFRGVREGSEMRLEGSGHTLDGKPVLAKVRFFDITPTSFEWENRVSLDGGETWRRDSAISARRAGES